MRDLRALAQDLRVSAQDPRGERKHFSLKPEGVSDKVRRTDGNEGGGTRLKLGGIGTRGEGQDRG